MLATAARLARRRAVEQLAGTAPGRLPWTAREWQLQAGRHVAAGADAAGEAAAAAVLAKARRLAAPVGVAAGLFGSLVGVGGGVLIVPTIVSRCKTIPQRLVSGTSLVAVVATAATSTYAYASSGCVDLGAALLIAPVAMLTAPLGARLTMRLDCAALRRTLGYFLLASAPMVPLKAYLLAHAGGEDGGGGEDGRGEAGGAAGTLPAVARGGGSSDGSSSSGGSGSGGSGGSSSGSPLDGITFPPPATAAVLMATGAVAGLASGLLGVGGGLIVTPLLAMTQPYGQATVLGTSLLSMIGPASAALLQHQRLGNVDWRMAAALAAGTALGSAAGSNAAVSAPPGALEAAFTLGMLFLGRKTLATAR